MYNLLIIPRLSQRLQRAESKKYINWFPSSATTTNRELLLWSVRFNWIKILKGLLNRKISRFRGRLISENFVENLYGKLAYGAVLAAMCTGGPCWQLSLANIVLKITAFRLSDICCERKEPLRSYSAKRMIKISFSSHFFV